MCEHKNLRTVGDRLFCKDCKQELPLEFLLNQCKPEEPAAEEPSEVIEEGNLEAEEILDDDGELIILKVCEEDGETYLEPIEDDNEFNEIGKIFEERLSELFAFDDEE